MEWLEYYLRFKLIDAGVGLVVLIVGIIWLWWQECRKDRRK